MATSTKKDDLLRKVAALLAKAESTEFEEERKTFMQAADNMMRKYSIELWELEQANASRIDGRKPIIEDFDYKFAFDDGPFPEIHDALWSLWLSVARHANCVVAFHKQHYSGVRNEFASYTIPVIGTESDLGYMTLLFSSLMTQLIEATHPKPDPTKEMFENLCLFREAGIGWDEAGQAMQDAGFLTDMPREKARDNMLRYYRKECKVRGVPQNYNHWKTFRRNFASGFSSRVDARLRDMRQESGQALGSGMELALRDQRKINEEFMFECFPRSGMTRGGSVVKSSKKIDLNARNAGHRAGDKANISIHPGKGVRRGGGGQLNK